MPWKTEEEENTYARYRSGNKVLIIFSTENYKKISFQYETDKKKFRAFSEQFLKNPELKKYEWPQNIDYFNEGGALSNHSVATLDSRDLLLFLRLIHKDENLDIIQDKIYGLLDINLISKSNQEKIEQGQLNTVLDNVKAAQAKGDYFPIWGAIEYLLGEFTKDMDNTAALQQAYDLCTKVSVENPYYVDAQNRLLEILDTQEPERAILKSKFTAAIGYEPRKAANPPPCSYDFA
ncbi:hypothetical protein [Legionella sp. 16cNR16C]|uniref:hypothetical protein n=1 Tax=Legionella sp. 16cNR16C TaxID=2905656 RepID=UPI001E37315C|nr:hypothetical protein [Legionella sp. 16cNR16C]MCE3043715.1 hypothetical protein [Legionella sp. 16cNR16C]